MLFLPQCSSGDILDTYEQERIPFAKSLVNTTDRVFTFVNKRGALAAAIRTRLIPLILPRLFKQPAIRRAAFRLVSQTRIRYPKSALSPAPSAAFTAAIGCRG